MLYITILRVFPSAIQSSERASENSRREEMQEELQPAWEELWAKLEPSNKHDEENRKRSVTISQLFAILFALSISKLIRENRLVLSKSDRDDTFGFFEKFPSRKRDKYIFQRIIMRRRSKRRSKVIREIIHSLKIKSAYGFSSAKR